MCSMIQEEHNVRAISCLMPLVISPVITLVTLVTQVLQVDILAVTCLTVIMEVTPGPDLSQ